MSAFNGHILGPRKLRALNNRLGTNFDKASRVTTHHGIARQIIDGRCRHFEFDWDTGVCWLEDEPVMHWSTCPPAHYDGPEPPTTPIERVAKGFDLPMNLLETKVERP